MMKNIKINILFIILLLLAGIPVLSFATVEEDWPTYMGNNYLTGNNDGIAPDKFNLLWSFKSGGVLYNPVPVNGKVLAVSTDGYLYCLDGYSGRLIWKFKADSPLTRMVAVYMGMVFLPGGRFIYCIDEKTGRVMWARRHETFGFYGTPTVADGKVYYGNRKGFYARDVNNGKLLWENNDIYTYGGFPAYWEGMVFTVSKNFNDGMAYLYSLDGNIGKVIWRQMLANVPNIFSPVIYDGKVYLTAGYSLFVFDAKKGEPVKKITFRSPVSSTPVFSQDSLFLSLKNGEILKIDPKKFEKRIIYRTSTGTQFVVVGSYIYIPEKGILNDVAVVDAESGKLIKKFSLPEGEPFTFTIAGGVIYIPTGRKLYAIGKGVLRYGESAAEVGESDISERAGKYEEFPTSLPGGPVAQHLAGAEKLNNKAASEEKRQKKMSSRIDPGQSSYEKKSGGTARLRGRVVDEKTGAPIEGGEVTATTRMSDGSVVMNRTPIKKGNFSIDVPRRGKTDIIISARGYLLKSIVLPDEKAINDLSIEPIEIALPKAEKGEKMRVESIHFKTNSANLEPESIPTLKKLLEIMRDNPNIKIEIDGHTDSTGSKEYNMKLSLMRANAVKYWLVRNGISEDRITTEGFGDTRPIADNSTPEGRQKNRRTEIIIKDE